MDKLIPHDPPLQQALSDNAAAGLPAIDVSPALGKFLHILARIQDARRILEIGTLGGYSTIWMARALPQDGKLITLEIEPKHADIASVNIKRAGLSSFVEIRRGPALDLLQLLWNESTHPFDLIFIDADKQSNPAYLEWAIRFSRPGTIIVCDNVVRKGALVDAENREESIQASADSLK